MESPERQPSGSSLVDSTFRRRTTLCALYFAQGVPFGFMTTALTSHLKEQDETIGTLEIGVLLTMCTLPWAFKFLWGPVIDSVTLRSMGRRRPWILLAQLMMATTMITLLLIGDLSEQLTSEKLTLLGWMFFLHNCFASLQDVATDALAVDILPPQ